ncbi:MULTISPECIES: immune inhibitor A domain-containing protein [Exiguobacterium]|uniref:Immune inhibitor A n=1 Tax=Exiguobacterium oxidotolerans TaxID=223958 RepID=A0A653I8T9_9BACL|nr:immune inhibitor A domain-containing protein [Exiguobacterium oxidotolerans]VWX35314.1 Immune inhibitor A [Exiguobacterium oxidotolerans]
MGKKKQLSLAVLSGITAAAFAVSPVLPGGKVKSVDAAEKAAVGAPMDLNTVDQERLLKVLQDRGVVSKASSAAEKQKAVQKYLDKKSNGKPAAEHESEKAKEFDQKTKDFLTKQKDQLAKQLNKKHDNYKKGKKDGFVKVDKAKQAKYNGDTRTDKVLVLLVEYSDFKHNNVVQEDGYMYSNDFNQKHYQDLMFGNKEFELFNGDKVKTFKQYYEEQSGGSYTVDGKVSNWLTVPGTAKDYGSDNPAGGNDNLPGAKGPRGLVKDSLNAAVKSGINLAEYDQFDQYDMDGDGDLNEPDGLVDHLMIIHAGTGQEAGGGTLGDDAIWSHRWTLGNVYPVADSVAKVNYWGGKMAAYDYTVQPEDGAVGVFAHEFGHDLGLPDEYDTQYTGQGEPVASWSIMSGGSWNGKVAGTEPTSFSPQNKEFFQNVMGGNWANIETIDFDSLSKAGTASYIDQSVTKSKNPGIIKVDLPKKPVKGIAPAFGKKYYYSTKGNDLHTSMTSPEFDLTAAKAAKFDYKAYFDVEFDYDFLTVTATAGGVEKVIDVIGDEDTDGDQRAESSKGAWVDKSYDLSEFAGKKVTLKFDYTGDAGLALDGFALDNAKLTVDGKVVFEDDAEGTPKFKLDGFIASDGFSYADNAYYLEWRNYAGSDKALEHARGVKYNTGLVVWYADSSFTDNWVGVHPGEGFLGVVDSHPEAIVGTLKGKPVVSGSTRYQVADAAFSYDKAPSWLIDSPTRGLYDYKGLSGVTKFDDSKSYINQLIPDAGKLLPNNGLKIQVIGEAKDNSAGAVWIHR